MYAAPFFPFHDPPSQTQFQNDEIVPYLILSELFDWSHAFVLHDSLLKLNYSQEYRNQSCRFGLFTRQSRSVQLHSRVLRLYRAMKSRDKIAGVTSVLVCLDACVLGLASVSVWLDFKTADWVIAVCSRRAIMDCCRSAAPFGPHLRDWLPVINAATPGTMITVQAGSLSTADGDVHYQLTCSLRSALETRSSCARTSLTTPLIISGLSITVTRWL